MLPAFDADGNLPPGIHWADWAEIENRFGRNERRQELIEGLRRAVEQLKVAGCRAIFIDGSFVTGKKLPNDFDACWDTTDADPDKLDSVFFDFDNGRAKQKAIFRGELFPAQLTEGGSGNTFLDFFQVDKNTGNPKGIVGLDLTKVTR